MSTTKTLKIAIASGGEPSQLQAGEFGLDSANYLYLGNDDASDNILISANGAAPAIINSDGLYLNSQIVLSYENGGGHQYNTFVGINSHPSIITGANYNSLFGYAVGGNLTSGEGNTCIGAASGIGLTTQDNNTLIGKGSGGSLTSANNTCLGFEAGTTIGGSSVCLGYQAGKADTDSNVLYIENSNDLTNPLLYGVFGTAYENRLCVGTSTPLTTGTGLTVNGEIYATGSMKINGYTVLAFPDWPQSNGEMFVYNGNLDQLDALEIGSNGQVLTVDSSEDQGVKWAYGSYLDADCNGDHTYSGIITTMTVDANSTGFGACMYIASDGNLEEADATDYTTAPCFGMAMESGTGSKIILLQGFVRDDTWDWTVGDVIYLSETTGAMTQTAPTGTGKQVQVVGIATHADRIYFNPNLEVTEV